MTQRELRTVAPDGLPARETGPWVHDKSFYLENYLSIFSRGMGSKWNGKLSYIDLFAGPGRSIIPGTKEVVEGSPFIALNHDFAQYVFVDVPEVIDTLRRRLSHMAAMYSSRMVEPPGFGRDIFYAFQRLR